MTPSQARDLIDDVFEEEALIIGGLAELHRVEDELIDRLFRSLAVVRDKALRRVENPKKARPRQPRRPGEPHPSIEQFLAKLGRS